MNPQPSREEAVFHAASEIQDPGERAAYLERACGAEVQLRERVEALLRAGQPDQDFLEQPALGARPSPAATASAASGDAADENLRPLSEKPGDRISHYKLLEQIGEGGCGVVYMADQEQPIRRRVALKIVKLGMDTKDVIGRFEAERQALALMDHPNIAKVLDAGATATGRPFFVMELVRGIKITDYCDENNLSTRARLDLFMKVCQAIQHAHQKGIIHRDIKPSNILVTLHDGEPVPKVIDFGIAKATGQQRLTDKTVFTAFRQFIGTPAYMSPEQAELTGLDIDTRSDIYSLGVLLYELLTGQTPFGEKELLEAGLDAMRRTIREKEPAKPSTRLSTMLDAERAIVASRRQSDAVRLIHLLRGDLDWIAMRCLEKDRNRRYETANGLARDIERHLHNEPVVASPPGRLYRLQKLVGRNKVVVVALGAVSTALVLGLALSTFLFVREAQQRRVARQEATKSGQVVRILKEMLEGVGPSVALGRDTTLLKEILDKTAKRVSTELTNQPEVEAELRLIICRTYDELGDHTNALAMVREALRLRKFIHGNSHPAVADALNSLSVILQDHGDLQGAEAAQREALVIRRRHAEANPADLAKSLVNLANVLQARGDLPGAEAAAREGLALARKSHPREHQDIVGALSTLANVRGDQGELNETERLNREALAMEKALVGEVHPTVALLVGNLALTLQQEHHDLAAAEAMHRECLALSKALHGEVHPAVAEALSNLGEVLYEEGDFENAERNYRQALALRQKLFGDEHPDVILSLRQLAQLYVMRNEFAKGEKAYEEVLALQKKTFGEEHPEIASSLHGLALARGMQGDFAASQALEEQALAMRRKLYPAEHLALAESLNQLGTLAAVRGELAEAGSLLDTALTMLKKLERTNSLEAVSVLWALGWVRQQAGEPTAGALRDQAISLGLQDLTLTRALTDTIHDFADLLKVRGRSADAEPLLLEAWSCWEKFRAPEKTLKWRRTALERLVRFYEETSRPDQATEWRRKLEALGRDENAPRLTTPEPPQ